MSVIDIASKFVGKRETGGRNRSQIIDTLNEFVGNRLGDPYCAAGVSYCLDQAKTLYGPKDAKIPKTGSSFLMHSWFSQKGMDSKDPQDLLKWGGALGGWTNPDHHGHVFLIEKRFTSMFGLGKKVIALGTIEFNSNSAGSRDGEGIVRNKRKVGSKDFWFCDISGLPGGSYWA